MQENNINVKTNISKFHRQWIEKMREVQPLNKLRNKEKDVLAQIMYFNYKERDIKDEYKRAKIVFDYDSKQQMMDNININSSSFANCLTRLRKFNLISKHNILHKALYIIPEDAYKLSFNFIIENADSTEKD